MKYLILIAFVFIGCKSNEPKKVSFTRAVDGGLL